MTNTARAEAILAARHYKDQMEGDGAVGCFDAAAAVAELYAAGLLMPDDATTQPEAPTNDRWNLPSHRTEAGYPNCSTCDGGGCPDCTDPA